MAANISKIFSKISGSSFIGIDYTTEVKVPKNIPGTRGKNAVPNPQHGRITKKVVGSTTMVFGNSKSNAYDNMVKRRLVQEGKDPESFKISERTWGTRIAGTPFVEHVKDGAMKHYLEMIFIHAGESKYYLDGVEISKDEIIGLPVQKANPESQGGVDNKVQIRTISIDSIDAIRTEGTQFDGPFVYEV